MEFNYSIIIPHKNCPNLLQRCIDSIPEREDVQIIVIDDNSDEGKKPSIKREGVEIVLLDADHAKGAGRARNVGLEHAKGKWLLFADADDYFTEFLSNLLDKYETDSTYDLVYLNANQFDENGIKTPHKTDILIRNYIQKKKKSELDLRYGLWTPWSRMVKKSIVDTYTIRFDEIPAGNDVMFGLKCSKYQSVFSAELEFVYNYFRPSGGSVTDSARSRMSDQLYKLRGEIINFYNEVGYVSIDNFFSLFVRDVGKRNTSLLEAIDKYYSNLKKYKINFFRDIYRFSKYIIIR